MAYQWIIREDTFIAHTPSSIEYISGLTAAVFTVDQRRRASWALWAAVQPTRSLRSTIITSSFFACSPFLSYKLTMSTDYQYERLPTSDEKRRYPRQEPTSDLRELHRRLEQDPRFNPPTPSVWKRIALIVFLVMLLWLGLKLRLNAIEQTAEPKVVHAQRYVTTLRPSVATGRAAERLGRYDAGNTIMVAQVLQGLQVPPCGEPYHHGEAEGWTYAGAGCGPYYSVKVR